MTRKAAGPSFEAPPGCEEFLLSCILVTSVSLILHPGSFVSLYPCMFDTVLSILRRGCSMLSVPEAIKICPTATQRHQKVDTQINGSPTPVKKVCCNLSSRILISGIPDVRIQSSKSSQKVAWKSAHTKTLMFPGCPENISKVSPEIHTKSIKIQAWTPTSPFLCSQMPLDRSMVTQGAKRKHQTRHSTGLWHQKGQHPSAPKDHTDRFGDHLAVPNIERSMLE